MHVMFSLFKKKKNCETLGHEVLALASNSASITRVFYTDLSIEIHQNIYKFET